MKCGRHLCQAHPGRTAAIAPVRPWGSSETTSLTPERPRAARPRRNWVQVAPSSAVKVSSHGISRRPSARDHGSIDGGCAYHPALLAGFDRMSVQPEVGIRGPRLRVGSERRPPQCLGSQPTFVSSRAEDRHQPFPVACAASSKGPCLLRPLCPPRSRDLRHPRGWSSGHLIPRPRVTGIR